jgi:hypothetical protein
LYLLLDGALNVIKSQPNNMSCQFCGQQALTAASHPQVERPVLLCGNLVCRAEFKSIRSQLIGAPPKRSMAETAAFEGAQIKAILRAAKRWILASRRAWMCCPASCASQLAQ